MSAPIRICMIGAGRVGKLHSGTLKRHVPGGDVVALVDPWAEVRDATGDEFGTWGAAMIAGKAVGLYDDLAAVAAAHATPAGPALRPSAEAHALYRPLVDRHVALQGHLLNMFMQEESVEGRRETPS